MNPILSIFRREVRSAFSSLLAYVFFSLFLAVSVFSFFPQFWANGVASLAPFFRWQPVLLLVIVPPLTMRVWAEERRQKTLEVLMTYPIKPEHAVLGKFFASWFLVLVSLALTLGIPMTVARYGPMDTGPVIGGYIATAAAGAAYISIGLFVSALCNSQILAYLLTLVVCAALWVVGEDFAIRFAGEAHRPVLEAIGLGARFRNISKGFLDLRDIVYYLGIVATFLFFNVRALALRKWLN